MNKISVKVQESKKNKPLKFTQLRVGKVYKNKCGDIVTLSQKNGKLIGVTKNHFVIYSSPAEENVSPKDIIDEYVEFHGKITIEIE